MSRDGGGNVEAVPGGRFRSEAAIQGAALTQSD